MLGKSAADLTHVALDKMVDDPRWERTVGSLQLALAMQDAGQSIPSVSETALCVDDRVIHARLVPVYQHEAERPTHLVTFLRDVSVETQGWRAHDETFAELSHKLRGPMTAIASYSDLLLGEAGGLEGALQRRYLERIRRGVERLESVLNEFGDEASSPARRTTPVPPHPTSQVINQTVDAMQKELSLGGVNVARDIGQNLPPVQADAEYVSRILTDLLAAAGRRTSVGESVDISTQVQFEDGEPGHLVVLIQSGGTPGQDRLPFEEDEDVRGVLALVENAGGRIWAERKPDGGALMTLLLPVAESVLSKYQLTNP
jgi:signal transduction histidine kinase